MIGSAMLVHLAHGAVQAHFLFFAMLPVVGLYLDWLPFALSVGFVVFHHAVVGVIAPDQVFGEGGTRCPTPSAASPCTPSSSSSRSPPCW